MGFIPPTTTLLLFSGRRSTNRRVDEVTDDAIEVAAEDVRRAAEARKPSFLRMLWPWRK